MALCILGGGKKPSVPNSLPAHAQSQLQAHILNTDFANYSLCLERFKKLTLSLMQCNG